MRNHSIAFRYLLLLLTSLLLPIQGLAAEEEDEFPTIAYPIVDYGTGTKAAQIQRGESLVKAGDCISCHTALGGGEPFAGGLAIKTPFGTIYSQNITPDQKTGIGRWTDEQFITAMREGIDPEGSYYYPVFPFVYFNKMSREDILAIRAYLNAIPAVNASNKPLEMHFPFNIRLLQSFWRFMFFDAHNERFQVDEHQSPEWNRGAYLVEGPGHCTMCHTPLNPLGAPIEKYAFTGGLVEGYSAPNISASALKDVPIEKIINVFRTNELIRGGTVRGPMLQVNHNSLRYLSTGDLAAIATYLKSVESELPPAPKTGKGDKAGKSVYLKYCAGCHDQGGGNAPKFGDAADWAPLIKTGEEQLYHNAIEGIRGMPPKGNCSSCTDDQIHLAVDYIVKNSRPAEGEEIQTHGPVESATSLSRGQEVYNHVCSVCHAEGLLGSPKLGNKTVWEPLIKENNIDVLVDRAIHGYKGHPPKGACNECTSADIIAAVKYMAQESSDGDYRLW